MLLGRKPALGSWGCHDDVVFIFFVVALHSLDPFARTFPKQVSLSSVSFVARSLDVREDEGSSGGGAASSSTSSSSGRASTGGLSVGSEFALEVMADREPLPCFSVQKAPAAGPLFELTVLSRIDMYASDFRWEFLTVQ